MQLTMVAYLSVYAAYIGGLFECICSIHWWLIRVYMQHTLVAYLSVYAAYIVAYLSVYAAYDWHI